MNAAGPDHLFAYAPAATLACSASSKGNSAPTCRRPNSDVLARERERVGPGLSVPVAPPSHLAPSLGGAFYFWNQSLRSELSRCGSPKTLLPQCTEYAWPRFGGAFPFWNQLPRRELL